MDNRLTLSNLPVELQRTVVSYLNDYEDINSLSRVNTTLHKICEDVSVWKSLCYRNFTEVWYKIRLLHSKFYLLN